MAFFKIVAVVLLLNIVASESISSENEIAAQSTYKAAVVEFNVQPGMSGKQRIFENTGRVIEIIQSFNQQKLDILVFPEYILNDLDAPVHLPQLNNHSLCNMSGNSISEHLQSISCAVQRSSTYVVINLIVDEDSHSYNMAIVFDRNGAVIARYRKYNLYNEDVRKTATPDITTFTTDFNVTFGIFICFDILFKEPAMTLVNNKIKNFVFPSSWYSELPYMTALQSQHSWAYTNNVILLAANRNCPSEGSSGSGIYAGRFGALKTFVSEEARNSILIADVPCNLQSRHEMERISHSDEQNEDKSFLSEEQIVSSDNSELNLWQEDLRKYTIEILKINGANLTKSICKDNVCCKFTISVEDHGTIVDKSNYYYAIAFTNSYRKCRCGKNLQANQKVCSVIACTRENDKKSCGRRFSPKLEVHQRYRFTVLNVTIELPKNNFNAMPNSLTEDLLPLETFLFEKNELEDNRYRIHMNLTSSRSDILTFGVYIRDYENDILPNVASSSIASVAIVVNCFSVLFVTTKVVLMF